MMKSQNKHSFVPLIFCLQLMLSCSGDDPENEIVTITEPDPIYTISDLDATLEENPEDGTVLGTLTTNLPGSLTFTSSNTAFDFDVASLEVTVADKEAFDYESNMTLTGTIILSNGEDSVSSSITITLTDFVDAIQELLTTSKDTYVSASQGDWIEVTKDEFEALENQLEEITHSGTSPEDYDFDINSTGFSSGNNDTSGRTVANISDATLPEGSYLFGIRFYVGTGTFGVCENNKVKLSETNVSEGYVDVGNPLPEKTSTEREVFFILKGNFSATMNSGHLALYFAPKNGGTFKDSSIESVYFQAGDVSDFAVNILQDFTIAYQGLSTTKLQWE